MKLTRNDLFSALAAGAICLTATSGSHAQSQYTWQVMGGSWLNSLNWGKLLDLDSYDTAIVDNGGTPHSGSQLCQYQCGVDGYDCRRIGGAGVAYDRILKVSRTIADLAEASAIAPEHVEAIQYRTLDRNLWH